MDNTETMAPVTESAPTETSAPVESSKGDQVEATMSAVFDKMNPTGETDGRTPPEAAQYGKDYETSPESEQVQALEDEQAQGLDTPQAWGKKALGIWNGMSDEAKEFVMHRERESTQKITELGQAARDAKVMAELFDSHREFIPQVQADGRPMTQAAAFETLLSVDRQLKLDPAGTLLKLAHINGVDLHQLVGAPPVPEGYLAAAEVEQRAMQLAQQHIANYQQQQAYQQQQQQWTAQRQQREHYLTAEIERFAKDASRADHWAEAEDDIYREVVALKAEVEAGIEPVMDEMTLLKKAYDRATSRNPAIFVKTAAGKEHAAEARRKADEAKRLASLNAKGKLGTAPRAAAQSMEDTMTEVYERLHGRSY